MAGYNPKSRILDLAMRGPEKRKDKWRELRRKRYKKILSTLSKGKKK